MINERVNKKGEVCYTVRLRHPLGDGKYKTILKTFDKAKAVWIDDKTTQEYARDWLQHVKQNGDIKAVNILLETRGKSKPNSARGRFLAWLVDKYGRGLHSAKTAKLAELYTAATGRKMNANTVEMYLYLLRAEGAIFTKSINKKRFFYVNL